MSYGVMRGSPEESQRYLDTVIDAILQNGRTRARSREQVNLAEIMFHCLKTNPGGVHTINGATGEKFTNEQILKRAVSIARALMAVTGTEKKVIVMVRNHEHMSALYYSMFLAGTVAFMMEPGSTEYEIQHFLSLVEPCLFFCEPDCRDDVISMVDKSAVKPKVVAADGSSLDKFVEGHSDDLDSFQFPKLLPESDAIMLPTSGSTGLPKAGRMTHQGLVVQLPASWQYHSTFPSPTRLVLLLSTGQWMTHTIVMTGCAAYQVPVLVSPIKMTPEYAVALAEKYKPTWAFTGPANAAAIGHAAAPGQLTSFETICMGGSPFAPEALAPLKVPKVVSISQPTWTITEPPGQFTALCMVGSLFALETLSPLKAKMSPTALLTNVYGLTETQGFVTVGTHADPLTTIGKILNILDYRLVNDDGEDVTKPYEKGELYLKGKCIIKGYLKNDKAYRESVTSDGWLKTGDLFHRNEEDQLFFANRTKLGFKYLDRRINPEEHELVIAALPGVKECVMVGTEDLGPAAAIVLLPGSDLTREDIHHAINSTLQDYKRLVGGIAFVPALPRTHSGKVRRDSCLQMVLELVAKGECY